MAWLSFGAAREACCRRLVKRLGAVLIRHAEHWAGSTQLLEWIDLQVLSANQAAVALYRKAGFSQAGEIPHMFKIDGHSFAYMTMTMPCAGRSSSLGSETL
ncbi:GNAT family N-acetyltransferase [Pseudomonas sp. ML96]|uniref:GNAT family N-acetyltransferase n=1 Tax=Pseudomonas sp. ML96 TaxID=1523503 RepID=UPI0009DF270E